MDWIVDCRWNGHDNHQGITWNRLMALQEMRVRRKAISANIEEMKAAIRAGQEKTEAVANAIWSKFEEIAISNLVEGIVVSVDKWTQCMCEELHMESNEYAGRRHMMGV